MLQCCVCRRSSSSFVTLCIVDKRCVLEQKLLLTAYRKSYMRNRLIPKFMTLTFVYRSYQGHINHCVTFDVEYLGNPSKGPPIGNDIWSINSNGHVTDDVTWPQSCCQAVRSAIAATAWLLVCSATKIKMFRLPSSTSVGGELWVVHGFIHLWHSMWSESNWTANTECTGARYISTHICPPLPSPILRMHYKSLQQWLSLHESVHNAHARYCFL